MKKYKQKSASKKILMFGRSVVAAESKGSRVDAAPEHSSKTEIVAELDVLRKLAGILTIRRDPESGLFFIDKDLLHQFRLPIGKAHWKINELSQLIFKEDFQPLSAQLAQSIAAGHAIDVEFRVQLPNGELRWVRCHSVFTDKDQVGKLPNYWAIQDITSYRFAVSNLRHQLEMANRRLQQTNQSLTGFSYALSHDLKRPIRHIRSYCDLALDTFADGSADRSECMEYLHRIGKAAIGMSALIEKMQKFSEIGSYALDLEKIDHEQLITEIMIQLPTHSGEAAVHWTFSGNCSEVVADKVLWRTLWLNLIDNALKYSRFSKSTQLSFDCSTVRGGVRCLISDNGIGFDLAQTTQLFEVFHRLTSDKRYEGHGIELAQVRRIVEAHGGLIMTTSTPGEGATFCVVIPSFNG